MVVPWDNARLPTRRRVAKQRARTPRWSLVCAAACVAGAIAYLAPQAFVGIARAFSIDRALPRTQMLAAATFDPWSALSLPVDSDDRTIKKQYKKLIAKYHPDIDPSPTAAERLEQVVQAYAVLTGEDKKIDQASLLKNAVNNLRDEMENRKRNLEELKQKALDEEEELRRVDEFLAKAKIKSDETTQELGMLGGAALGLLVAGPVGGIFGGFAGLALKDDETAVGKTIRSVGGVGKSLANVVSNAVDKESKNQKAKAKDSSVVDPRGPLP